MGGTSGLRLQFTGTSSVSFNIVNPTSLHIDWGDGYSDDYTYTGVQYALHYYTPGDWVVTISGMMDSLNIGNGTSELTSIISGFDPVAAATLKSARNLFAGTSLVSVPVGLFDGCSSISNFEGCFSQCDNLVSVPSGLFSGCSAAQTFRSAFWVNKKLESIPSGLFDNCPLVTNFITTFYSCTALTGPAPALWLRSPAPDGSSCFGGDTGLSNYADAVAAGWA